MFVFGYYRTFVALFTLLFHSSCINTSLAFFVNQQPNQKTTNKLLHKSYSTVSSEIENTSSSTSTTTTQSMCDAVTVAQFQCLGDNYGYLIHNEKTGETIAIDTPCAASYRSELSKRNWTLTHILNTHHHYDHTGGNVELKAEYSTVVVYGPAGEQKKIPGIDVALEHGDAVPFGTPHDNNNSIGEATTPVSVLEVGGHTIGHIAYYFPAQKLAFVGDSLFALGCGKMFEGTPSQFWNSLLRLRSLPDDTAIYCAHEYTTSNAKFALSIEPGNMELQERVRGINKLRAKNLPTVPSNLGLEKRTNPFLRVDISPEIRENVNILRGDDDAVAFGKVRSAKDRFRG